MAMEGYSQCLNLDINLNSMKIIKICATTNSNGATMTKQTYKWTINLRTTKAISVTMAQKHFDFWPEQCNTIQHKLFYPRNSICELHQRHNTGKSGKNDASLATRKANVLMTKRVLLEGSNFLGKWHWAANNTGQDLV